MTSHSATRASARQLAGVAILLVSIACGSGRSGGADTAKQSAGQSEDQLMSQGLDLRIQTLQQIGPILTQEQRDKLAQLGPAAMWRGHRHHKPPQQG